MLFASHCKHTPQRYFRSPSTSSGTFSAEEVPETDLDELRGLSPQYLKFLYRIAKKIRGTKRNARIKGHRPIDDSPLSRRRTRHSPDDESLEEVNGISFRHSEGMRYPSHAHALSVSGYQVLQKIFHGTFLPANLTELGQNVTDRDSDTPQTRFS